MINLDDLSRQDLAIIVALAVCAGIAIGWTVNQYDQDAYLDGWNDGWEESCQRWSEDPERCQKDAVNYGPDGEQDRSDERRARNGGM